MDYNGVKVDGRSRTGNKTLVKWLVRKILVMLLEVLFRWAHKLHSHKLVAVYMIR